MSASRFIDLHGRQITKINYSQSDTDSYGDPQYGTSSTTVQAVYNRSVSGAVEANATGLRLTDTADVSVAASVSVDGPEASRPTTFKLDGNEYKVVQKDVQPDLIKCRCERKNA